MKPTVLVGGTRSWKTDGTRDWYYPSSGFSQRLPKYGLIPIVSSEGDPFIWDTQLGGIGFGDGDLTGWAAAGKNLYYWCVPPLCPDQRLPSDTLTVICHSHGLQVVLFACAYGLKVGRLISVASPVRKDMRQTTGLARPRIRSWTHVHSDKSDWWQVMGAMFDGKLGIMRKHPAADRNVFVKNVGHTGLLRDADHFPVWDEILDELPRG